MTVECNVFTNGTAVIQKHGDQAFYNGVGLHAMRMPQKETVQLFLGYHSTRSVHDT